MVEDVLRSYSLVIEQGTPTADAFIRRGEAYLHLEQHERALADFHEALVLEPSNIWAKDYVAMTLLIAPPPRRDLQRAYELSKEVVAVNSDAWGTLQTHGYIQYRLGQYEAAAVTLRKAIGLRPDGGNPLMLLFLAMAEFQSNDPTAAVEHYAAAKPKVASQTELPTGYVNQIYLEATRLLAEHLRDADM